MDISDDDLSDARRGYQEYLSRVTDVTRAEVVAGHELRELHERSAADGVYAFDVFFHISRYLQDHPRGRLFRPAPPFLLSSSPRTIRVPDVAFIETHKLASAQPSYGALCPIVPDLIAEVISHPARWNEVDARVADFLEAGTPIAWILDTMEKRLIMRRASGETRVFDYNANVCAAPVLPRLNLRVYELLGE